MIDNVRIMLDSTSSYDDTCLKDDPRCHVVKLITRHGNEEWLDGEKSIEEMFAMIEKTGKLPQTSQPPIGEVVEAMRKLVLDGKKILFLAVDSVLSGTYQGACVAAQQVMDEVEGADIRVVDTHTCSAPIACMAIELLKLTGEGMNLDEAEALALDMSARTETYLTVDTLTYLQKGGRIGAVGALVGSILGIRPIIHLDKDGKLEVADKCRTRKKSLKRMAELAASYGPLEAIQVAQATCLNDAEMLKQQMEEIFPDIKVVITSCGTSVATHLGPGAIGIFVRRKA